jgi:hypothetical protein
MVCGSESGITYETHISGQLPSVEHNAEYQLGRFANPVAAQIAIA